MSAPFDLSVEVWAYKTSLTPPLFIEMHVPRLEIGQSCICVLGVMHMYVRVSDCPLFL
jgi:hypothetical protein